MSSWQSRKIQPWRLRLGREPKLTWSKGWDSLGDTVDRVEVQWSALGRASASCSESLRVGKIRGPWKDLKLGIKVPRREEGSRVPVPDVLLCFWLRDPVGGCHYVTLSSTFQSICSDFQHRWQPGWGRPHLCLLKSSRLSERRCLLLGDKGRLLSL